jgi:CelD/BcsL family acetyltransferase involved in cellulose biosynthesis/glycosyltransferase involved in cell wall biosynthesis
VAYGHRSLVIACDGSRVAGELVALPAVPEHVTHETWVAMHEATRRALCETLAHHHVDVVHVHGIDFHAYLPPPGPVVLATLHLPLDWYPREVFQTTRPDTFLQCVSRRQRLCAPAGSRLLAEIENGVDLDRLRPRDVVGDYALVLGRICPEKGQHLALQAASRAGVPLVVAGKVFGFAEHEEYFATQVVPRLAPPHRFIGAVAGEDKARLLAGACCVVVPSIVDETSSLVAMEALACGTPVVAFRRGALVDLVDHGETGFLVDTIGELAQAIGAADQLDRARCRAVAESRCSLARMCERYLARYQQLATTKMKRARGLRVEIVDRAGLAALSPAWTELWTRARDATVFQRPEWCLPWCDHLLTGEVEALAVWKHGSLAGLLPLFRWRDGERDVLSLIGAGVSDYQDLLLAPGAADVVQAIEDTLAMLAWDRIELSELRDDSVLLELELGGTQETADQEPCLALPVVAHAPLEAVRPGARHEIEYQRRRAARTLGLEYALLPPGEAVGALTSLHRARWATRGEPGMIDEQRHAFLQGAARRLAIDGSSFALGVSLGRELAAVGLILVDRDCTRYYMCGFAPTFERYSPGMLAMGGVLEESARRGARFVDLLRGDEPFKYRLGAVERVRLHRRVVRRVD